MGMQEPMAGEARGKLGRLYHNQGMMEAAETELSKAIAIYSATGDFYDMTHLAAAQSLLAQVPGPSWTALSCECNSDGIQPCGGDQRFCAAAGCTRMRSLSSGKP